MHLLYKLDGWKAILISMNRLLSFNTVKVICYGLCCNQNSCMLYGLWTCLKKHKENLLSAKWNKWYLKCHNLIKRKIWVSNYFRCWINSINAVQLGVKFKLNFHCLCFCYSTTVYNYSTDEIDINTEK